MSTIVLSTAYAPPSRTLSPSEKPTRKWYQWFEPGTSAFERRLVLKLDVFILLYMSLAFFSKFLDQSNVTNAYVTGMREDLNLTGSELNWMSTFYNIGIIVGGPFFTIALTRVPPSYWMPGCMATASLFVLFIFKAEKVETIYALRFCAGIFLSGIIPGAFYVIGSWYRKYELARRAVIVMISYYGGSMFSGYLQAGLQSGMNRRDGLAAWRWLFIFDAIIGVPIAAFGFFCCPDEPHGKRMWWMSEEERLCCIRRLEMDGRDPFSGLEFWKAVRRILKSWQFWCFPVAYAIKEATCGEEATQWMTLYLKSTQDYSLEQVNAIPSTVGASIIVITIFSGIMVDYCRNPPLIIFILAIFQIFGYSVLLVWPSSRAFKLAIYIIAGGTYGAIGPLQNAWANSVCGGDKYLRAATTAMISTLGYVSETPSQQHFFLASDAPTYRETNGFAWSLSWTVMTVVWSCIVLPLVERYAKTRSISKSQKTEIA